jgi:DNA-binding helix-hairpin-helix protein with protein kinase domain
VELLPGFGTLLVNTLLEWKAELIRKFQYNPSQGIPVNDMIAVNHRFTQEKIALQKELMAGLKEISITAARHRSSIQGFLIANDLID